MTTNKAGSTVNKSDCTQSVKEPDDEHSQEDFQQIQDFLVGQGGESNEWSRIQACLHQSETNIKAFISSKYIDILQTDKASSATSHANALIEMQKLDKTTRPFQSVLCRQL